jgi:AraC-like DNA-binding protein
LAKCEYFLTLCEQNRFQQGNGRKLAVSPRNLQKQLKKEGVTYQKLLDHVRKEQAVYFLEKTNVAISEIALLLGYSEQSVFSRAFKRWVGSTPGQFRTRIKSNR